MSTILNSHACIADACFSRLWAAEFPQETDSTAAYQRPPWNSGVLDNAMLGGNGNLLAGVADDLVRFALGHDTNSVVRADEDHLEAAVG